jgi:hypothetical protein
LKNYNIEEGNLHVKHAQWYDDNEEAAIDVHVEYGTKTLIQKVSYKEASGEHSLVLQEGKLMGKEPKYICCTKCLNSVPGDAACFISAT